MLEFELIEVALSLASEQAERDAETRSALKRRLYRRALASLETPPGFE